MFLGRKTFVVTILILEYNKSKSFVLSFTILFIQWNVAIFYSTESRKITCQVLHVCIFRKSSDKNFTHETFSIVLIILVSYLLYACLAFVNIFLTNCSFDIYHFFSNEKPLLMSMLHNFINTARMLKTNKAESPLHPIF